LKQTYEELLEQNRYLAKQLNLLVEKYNTLKVIHDETLMSLEASKEENVALTTAVFKLMK
jgi:hypothetical protein